VTRGAEVAAAARRVVKVELGERAYEIIVERGLLERCGRLIAEAVPGADRFVIITNTAVGRLYGPKITAGLRAAGFDVSTIEVPAGERYKSLTRADKIYGRLLEMGVDRQAVIVALGGGVIGDLAGFVAGTYMRGVPFVQIPTSLLAQVDSSVGGKTAVNHRLAKNVIGVFNQPRLVLIDPEALRTLPSRELRAGLSEIIKYGFIGGEPLLSKIRSLLPLRRDLDGFPSIIVDCCRFKAQIVVEDELDTGRRAILNYGHTIGHALEAVSSYRQYNHGEAIAVGMLGAAKIAQAAGMLDQAAVDDHRNLLKAAGLPLTIKDVDPMVIYRHLELDKKRARGRNRLVLLDGIGRPVIREVEGPPIIGAIEGLAEV
jgi:3-dehydroquinate synthase